eukprot:scaffold23834_cov158-Skeletonema_marinoi.AAC.4
MHSNSDSICVGGSDGRSRTRPGCRTRLEEFLSKNSNEICSHHVEMPPNHPWEVRTVSNKTSFHLNHCPIRRDGHSRDQSSLLTLQVCQQPTASHVKRNHEQSHVSILPPCQGG